MILPLLLCWFSSISRGNIPLLNSHPTAEAVIFLDFDGHTVESAYWQKGNRFTCAPSGMNAAQIEETFNRVAEDYRPFNINLTTDSTIFLKAPLKKRMRVIVTVTSAWYPGAAGVALVQSFRWGDDTPCFVFSDRLGPFQPKLVAEACAHEAGHTLGLAHQALYNETCNRLDVYNPGTGNGQIGWAPIMGNSYNRNLTLWNYGPTQSSCNYIQDNLLVLSSMNGFTYRADDFGDTLDTAENITAENDQFKTDGIITTVTDKDVFKIHLPQQGYLKLNASPYSVGANNDGANLDIKLTLYNNTRSVIAVYNPVEKLDAAIDTALQAGTYYVEVNGTGNVNTYNNYGSLGSYRISGILSTHVVLSEPVQLKGKTENQHHIFQWNLSADDVKEYALQQSGNGRDFMAYNTSTIVGNTVVIPSSNNYFFFRLQIVYNNGKTAYSNIVYLKPQDQVASISKPVFINNHIFLTTQSKLQYRLLDSYGRILRHGTHNNGSLDLSLQQYAAGIYLLQVWSNQQQQTFRFSR